MQPASAWVTRKDFQFTFDRVPERTEMHKDIKEALVVEFYAK